MDKKRVYVSEDELKEAFATMYEEITGEEAPEDVEVEIEDDEDFVDGDDLEIEIIGDVSDEELEELSEDLGEKPSRSKRAESEYPTEEAKKAARSRMKKLREEAKKNDSAEECEDNQETFGSNKKAYKNLLKKKKACPDCEDYDVKEESTSGKQSSNDLKGELDYYDGVLKDYKKQLKSQKDKKEIKKINKSVKSAEKEITRIKDALKSVEEDAGTDSVEDHKKHRSNPNNPVIARATDYLW